MNFDRLEQRADRNLMAFENRKGKVLHLGKNDPKHQYRLGADGLESTFAKKDLRFWMSTSYHEPAMHPHSKDNHQHPGLH